MPLVQVIVLGIVQGLTEFLPISSTAHLWAVRWLLGWSDQGGLAFDIALHTGTLAAVIVYFFRDWVQILAQGFGLSIGNDTGLAKNRGLLWLMVVATIPIGVAGYLLKAEAEGPWRSPYVVGAMLIAIGLLMWWSELIGRKQKDISHLHAGDALAIGAMQALAVVPGASRSGTTIAAGLFRNFDRPTAARFSFLISVPAVGAAAAKDFWDMMKHQGGIPPELHLAFIVGIAVSAISGILTIRYFLQFLRHRSLAFFVFYRVIFGIIVIALAIFRTSGR